ncbi:MAG: hypothetical protein RBU21_08640 [FCB group bacterium]|jgi:hypothetical protein|nr:hypothetical protein [FCB group bacterium]
MPETEGVVWEEYHDRSAGLMIFGLIQMGLGIIAILFCGLLGFSVTMSSMGGAMPAEAMRALIPMWVMTAIMMVAGAALLTTLGVGSIMARRWARSLSHALWTTALAYGVLMALMWLFMATSFGTMMQESMQAQMQRSAAASGQPAPTSPPAMASFMMVFMIVFSLLIGVGLPLPFVLFYRSKHVKATCEWRDPVPRWTDSRPAPVLVAGFLMFMVATTVIQQTASNEFYIGVVVPGLAGVIGAIVLTLALLAAGVGLMMKRMWGWGLATLLAILQSAVWGYAAVTGNTAMFNTSLLQLNNVATGAAAPEFMGHSLWGLTLGFVALTGFLFWLLRYFRGNSVEVPAA